jgi:ATP-dependent helicase HrpA
VSKPLNLNFGNRRVDPEGIHKALLSGLLSQIGLQQENEKKVFKNGKLQKQKRVQSEYLGSGGKKFVIFPGSALAKKPPEALMSAELVETSRLFARMNAAVDPAWAEELAGDLVRRSVSEPHWEKKLGAVIGLERVMLFGLTLVSNRKVQYSRIDPMLCRELFIRHALVYGEWDSKQVFDQKNKDLLIDMEAAADRARSPQLAAGEDDVFRFYNNRIPLDVFSTGSFEGWWKKAKHEKPEFLTMTKAELLGADETQLDEADYPGQVVIDGQEFSLSYLFDPGNEHDGVSVEVPISLLASIKPEGFEWLIPAMRLELITELIRSLPKAVRKNVVPAKDWAAKVLTNLPTEPTGKITEVLASQLQSLSGVRVRPEDFSPEVLPAQLKVSYRVLDSKAKQLEIGNDLAALQQQLAQSSIEAVSNMIQFDGPSIERSNLQTWDFDELPRQLDTKQGSNKVSAFPALVLDEKTNTVDLKLHSSEATQALEHPVGVVELVQLSIPSPVKYIEAHLTQAEKLAIASLPYPSLTAFVADVIRAGAKKQLFILDPKGLIFTAKEFENLRQLVEAISIELIFDVAKIMLKISQAASEANKAISNAKAIDFLTVLASEKLHIQQLLSPKLVSATGLDRLSRIEIYLRAITQRVVKLQESPERDRISAIELAKAIEVFEVAGGRLPLPQKSSEKLTSARWLLEELRVSLFAQSLGTQEAVSLKRIQKQLS